MQKETVKRQEKEQKELNIRGKHKETNRRCKYIEEIKVSCKKSRDSQLSQENTNRQTDVPKK